MIVQLVEKLTRWTKAYYDGEPLVSDEVFNNILNQLRQLDPGNPILASTGFGYKNSFVHREELPHRNHVGSIEDRIKFDDTQGTNYNWCDTTTIAMTKADGASIAVTYRNGKLYHALSRGDGDSGLNITNNVIASGSIPLTVKTDKEWFEVRCEAVISWEDFQKMDASHPRNKASGLSQSEYADPNEISKLLIIAYHIFDFDGTKLEMLDTLKELGFIVCPYQVFKNYKDFETAVIEGHYNNDESHKLPNGLTIPCDGAVLVEDLDPDNCIAVKYEDETALTVVESINWGATRTGRIVPVANYAEVFLSGGNLNNATCNNADWLVEMGVHVGATIKIRRSNMIIPEILEVINSDPSKIELPTHCPCCNSDLIKSGRDLKCPNDNCDTKRWESISRLFYYGEVKGIGDATAEAFYDLYKVDSIKDLKNAIDTCDFESLNTTIGPAFSEKLLENFKVIRDSIPTIYDYFWLAAIPKLGDASCQYLYENVDTNEFLQIVQSDAGVPEHWLQYCTTEPARENLTRAFGRIKEIADFFNFTVRPYEKIEKPEAKFKYALTGRFSMTKDALSEEFAQYGAEWVDVGDAQFILTNTPEKKSGKLKDAESRGIKILNEEQFRELIKS